VGLRHDTALSTGTAESAWARSMLDFGWIGGLGENLDLVLAREASEWEEVKHTTCVFRKVSFKS
jgi:hypothetical protein